MLAYAPFNDHQNLGAANAAVVKAGSGNVFSLTIDNENAADRYLLLLNQTSVPVNTQVPVEFFRVPALAQIVVGTDYFGPGGRNFPTGIAWAFSSTKDTVTLATATEQSLNIKYA